jgi:DNA-binding NarL/FixJ family response regulator
MSNHQSLLKTEKINSPIRILLVDDNDVVRNSLKLLISVSEELQLVGEASNGYEAISACAFQQPDLILMDINMPSMNGIEATRNISQRWPNVIVLALTSLSDGGNITKIIEAGAISAISKHISIDEIIRIIRESVKNNEHTSPSNSGLIDDTQNQDRTVTR